MAQLLDPEQWGRGPEASGADGDAVPRGAPSSAAEVAGDNRPPGPRRTGAVSGPTPTQPAAADWDPFVDESAAPPSPEPRRGASPPSAPPRRSSRLPLILILVLVVLALTAGGVWAAATGVLTLGGQAEAGGETPAAAPTDAPATDAPEPSASAPAEPAGGPVPASCGDLYSDGMRSTIESNGLALNPDWIADAQPGPAASEPALVEILTSAQRIDCYWVAPDGPGDVGIATAVASVSEEQAAEVESILSAEGYRAIEELGGRRFVLDRGGSGASHLVRDGLWFATTWTGYGPSGYTADMVTQVLG